MKICSKYTVLKLEPMSQNLLTIAHRIVSAKRLFQELAEEGALCLSSICCFVDVLMYRVRDAKL